jgi:N-acetylmuramoyl-L-alanine amidase
MGGTLAGTDNWFSASASQVSAHFGVGLDGDVHQYVDLGNIAWANGILEPRNSWRAVLSWAQRAIDPGVNPNRLTVSIETEDSGSSSMPVSTEQYAGVLAVCRAIQMRFPGLVVITGHDIIAPGSRAHCPGARWRASGQITRLARELGVAVF